MTDVNTAANAGSTGETDKIAALDKYLEKLQPVFRSPEQLDALRTKAAEEIGERRTWHQRILERFRVILAEQVSARGTDTEELKKNGRRIKQLLYDQDQKLYPVGETKLRGYTMCAYVQAYAEAWIKEQQERLTRLGDENLEQFGTYRVRGMVRNQVAKVGFMVDDNTGKLFFFRRHYRFTGLVDKLPEASGAVGKLLELIRRARSVDRYIDRHVLAGLAPRLKDKTISMEQLAAGEKGFCLAYIEEKKGKEHQGEGLILWYGSGQQVQVHRAFGHPGRFAEGRYLLEFWAPKDWVLSEQTIAQRNVFIEDNNLKKKATFLNQLWRECCNSDQSKIGGHIKDILEGKYILPIEEDSPEVAKLEEMAPVVAASAAETSPTIAEGGESEDDASEKKFFFCSVPGCTRTEPYKSKYGLNQHMAKEHGASASA